MTKLHPFQFTQTESSQIELETIQEAYFSWLRKQESFKGVPAGLEMAELKRERWDYDEGGTKIQVRSAPHEWLLHYEHPDSKDNGRFWGTQVRVKIDFSRNIILEHATAQRLSPEQLSSPEKEVQGKS